MKPHHVIIMASRSACSPPSAAASLPPPSTRRKQIPSSQPMRLINVLSIFILLHSAAFARIWTDNLERTIDAEMLEMKENKVLFKLKDGRNVWFDVAKLAQADQDYIKTQKEALLSKKILFIGNSYTAGIRKAMTEIIAASPHAKSELKFICPGGRTLLQHSENKEVLDLIKSQKWDFIVLQDQSQTPAVAYENFLQGTKQLDDLIDKSGAQTILYMTWGHRDGDKGNPQIIGTYTEMQNKLTKAYEDGAKAANAKIAPVGEAWRDIRSSNNDLGTGLYVGDGRHPSNKGAYLAANVFYRTLFGEDTTKLNFTFGLPDEECKMLQAAAEKAYKTYSK